MSAVAVPVTTISMPYSEHGLRLVAGVAELIERRQHRELVEWITEIGKLRHPDGEVVTQTELALALGVYAPKLGARGGNSMVSRWVGGSRKPKLRERRRTAADCAPRCAPVPLC